MSEPISTRQPPVGFELMPTDIGFLDALAPLYINREEEWPRFGLYIETQHANLMGICHGGVMMTLLDVGLSGALRAAKAQDRGVPTISLSVDFINAARIGDWLEFKADSVELKRRFGFASGRLVKGDVDIAQGKGLVYLPDQGFELDPRARAAFPIRE